MRTQNRRCTGRIATGVLPLIVLVVSLVSVSSCQTLPGLTNGPTPSSNPWLADERVAQAVAFRNKLGLRSDAAWVREVASMADAIYEFEVPLTPEEFELLQDRSDSIDAVLKAVEEYGRLHREEWAGASQDVRSGTVIARFTANVAEHQAALWAT